LILTHVFISRKVTLTPNFAFNLYMALSGLLCADVLLRTYTLTLNVQNDEETRQTALIFPTS